VVADLLGPLPGDLERRLGQDQRELVAAVATGHVVAAEAGGEEGAELADQRVPGGMPE